MQRTQEEYRIAVANAVAAGDNEAAEFLAKEAFNLYGKYKAPSPEEFIENPEPKLGYPISVPPVPDTLAKFPEEVLRRKDAGRLSRSCSYQYGCGWCFSGYENWW